ncbi:helix-turn-helix domain-containing protein [Providencia stuartii]
MVICNVEIKDTIETITAEIRESMTLLEMAYSESEDEKISAVISCVMRSTSSALRKADGLVNTLLTTKEYAPSKTEINTQTSFAARLRLALAHSGMTQADLAKQIGVSQSTISALATGRVKGVGIGRGAVLSEALGVNLRWLMLGEGEMLPAKNLTQNDKV